MNSFGYRIVTLAAAAIAGCSQPQSSLAQGVPATAPNITYTATGTFSSTVVSGTDQFKLAGEPFTLSVVANSASVPSSHGATWAKFSKLKMKGTVQSGLIQTPTSISDSVTQLELSTGNPSYDTMALFSPVTVVNLQIDITATIQMPLGTITKPLIHLFAAPVQLTSTTATVTYKEPSTGDATTLTIASGTVTTTLGGATVTAEPALQPVRFAKWLHEPDAIAGRYTRLGQPAPAQLLFLAA
jgi:hypothetical protein